MQAVLFHHINGWLEAFAYSESVMSFAEVPDMVVDDDCSDAKVVLRPTLFSERLLHHGRRHRTSSAASTSQQQSLHAPLVRAWV
jgi:hypothetical protein